MYINFKIAEEKSVGLKEIILLQAIHQNRTEDLSETIEKELDAASLQHFIDKEYIEYIKGKKNASKCELIRLTKKGKTLLEDIEIPLTTLSQLKMRDYLVDLYLNHEDTERIIGNKKSIATYISILQNHLGITIYQFYYLCEYFLAEYPYTKKLENIFWDKNKQRYKEFKNNIEDSTIHQFYEQHKADIENYWKSKGCA